MRLIKRKILWRQRRGWHAGMSESVPVAADNLPWLRRGQAAPEQVEPQPISARSLDWIPSPSDLTWLRKRQALPDLFQEEIEARRRFPWLGVQLPPETLGWLRRARVQPGAEEEVSPVRTDPWLTPAPTPVADQLPWLRKKFDQPSEEEPALPSRRFPWLSPQAPPPVIEPTVTFFVADRFTQFRVGDRATEFFAKDRATSLRPAGTQRP